MAGNIPLLILGALVVLAGGGVVLFKVFRRFRV